MRHKNVPLVYIASPYSAVKSWHKFPLVSSIIKYLRYRKVTKISGQLLDLNNVALICPITQSHHLAKFMEDNDGGFDRWKTIDFTYIAHCDTVWVIMLEGWEESLGVQAEIKFAKRKKIPVHYIDPEDFK